MSVSPLDVTGGNDGVNRLLHGEREVVAVAALVIHCEGVVADGDGITVGVIAELPVNSDCRRIVYDDQHGTRRERTRAEVCELKNCRCIDFYSARYGDPIGQGGAAVELPMVGRVSLEGKLVVETQRPDIGGSGAGN